jgi:fused signal recognition particle receptor
MFDFLKKKPGKDDAAPAAPPAPRKVYTPEELARAFDAVQEEKAARAALEREQTREALKETVGGSLLARSFGGLFARHPRLDDDLLDEIETALISADVGVPATTALIEGLRKRMKAREFVDASALLGALRRELLAMLAPVAKPLDIAADGRRPFVVLTVGVNGVGKTTTIGKLARRFQLDGHSLMLAAGDTFRAAATEQLEIWGQRTGCPVVRGKEGGDPSSVIFEGVKRAQAEGFDIVIADTAGRLHTKANLMEELQKVRRVTDKAMPGAPHETFLVLDSTNGQNAIHQAQMFKEAMGLSGIVLTKLDGTAKGGVILGICDELKIPVRYIGIGEKVEDLREFDAEEFVAALYEDADEPRAA